jgi:hypothetical protein
MKLHKLALWPIAVALAGFGSAAQAALWTATFMDMGVKYTLTDTTLDPTSATHTYKLELNTDGYTGPQSGAFLDSVNIKAWSGGSSEIKFELLDAPGGANDWRRTEGPISSGGLGNTGCRGGGGGGGGFACVEARQGHKGEFGVGEAVDNYSFEFSVTARNADSFLTLAEISQGAHVGAGYADARGRGNGFGVTDYTITTAIPEPETYAMMLVGLGLLGWVARRKKRLQERAAA